MAAAGDVVPVNGRHFVLGECIGRGGSARVHKVQCLDTGTTYAMKVVDGKNSKRMNGFSREINLLQQFIGEQDVVQLITHEVLQERYVIVMILEHADCSFDKHLRRVEKDRGRLSMPVILNFFKQMVRGVSAAHSRDIIHFDLKPENFLLFCDKGTGFCGEQGCIKLADFGIAGEIDSGSTHVLRNRKVGTVTYMAPETVYQPHEGPLILRKSADVWALGVILFRMVYKTTPFSHLRWNYTRLLIAISDPRVEVAFPDVRELREQDPEKFWTLQRIMRGCLRQEQEERWTIDDILEMLDLGNQKCLDDLFEIRHPQQAAELHKLMEEVPRRPASAIQCAAVSEAPGGISDAESCGSSYLSCDDPAIARLLAPQSREEASMMRRAAQSVQATLIQGSALNRKVPSGLYPSASASAGAASFVGNADGFLEGSEEDVRDDPTAESEVLAESELNRLVWQHRGQIPTPRAAALTLIEATSRSSLRSRRPTASTTIGNTGNWSPTDTPTRTLGASKRNRISISSSEDSWHAGSHLLSERESRSNSHSKGDRRQRISFAAIFAVIVLALLGALGSTGAAGKFMEAIRGPKDHSAPASVPPRLEPEPEHRPDPTAIPAPRPAVTPPDDGTGPHKGSPEPPAAPRPTLCRIDSGQCPGVSFRGSVSPNTSISCDPGFSGYPVGAVCSAQDGRISSCPVCTPLAPAPLVNSAGAAAAQAAEEQRRAAQQQRRNRERDEERQRDALQDRRVRSSNDSGPGGEETERRSQEAREEEARRRRREQDERDEAERKRKEEAGRMAEDDARKNTGQEDARTQARRAAAEDARREAARKVKKMQDHLQAERKKDAENARKAAEERARKLGEDEAARAQAEKQKREELEAARKVAEQQLKKAGEDWRDGERKHQEAKDTQQAAERAQRALEERQATLEREQAERQRNADRVNREVEERSQDVERRKGDVDAPEVAGKKELARLAEEAAKKAQAADEKAKDIEQRASTDAQRKAEKVATDAAEKAEQIRRAAEREAGEKRRAAAQDAENTERALTDTQQRAVKIAEDAAENAEQTRLAAESEADKKKRAAAENAENTKRVLTDAQQQAAKLTEDAAEEAEKTRRAAESEADEKKRSAAEDAENTNRVLKDAKQQAAKLTEDAAEEAEKTRRAAESEADEKKRSAAEDAENTDRVLKDAKQQAAKLTEDAAEEAEKTRRAAESEADEKKRSAAEDAENTNRVLKDAKQQAAKLTEDAAEEAEKTRRAAESEADEKKRSAAEDAENTNRVLKDAKQQAAKLTEDAAEEAEKTRRAAESETEEKKAAAAQDAKNTRDAAELEAAEKAQRTLEQANAGADKTIREAAEAVEAMKRDAYAHAEDTRKQAIADAELQADRERLARLTAMIQEIRVVSSPLADEVEKRVLRKSGVSDGEKRAAAQEADALEVAIKREKYRAVSEVSSQIDRCQKAHVHQDENVSNASCVAGCYSRAGWPLYNDNRLSAAVSVGTFVKLARDAVEQEQKETSTARSMIKDDTFRLLASEALWQLSDVVAARGAENKRLESNWNETQERYSELLKKLNLTDQEQKEADEGISKLLGISYEENQKRWNILHYCGCLPTDPQTAMEAFGPWEEEKREKEEAAISRYLQNRGPPLDDAAQPDALLSGEQRERDEEDLQAEELRLSEGQSVREEQSVHEIKQVGLTEVQRHREDEALGQVEEQRHHEGEQYRQEQARLAEVQSVRDEEESHLAEERRQAAEVERRTLAENGILRDADQAEAAATDAENALTQAQQPETTLEQLRAQIEVADQHVERAHNLVEDSQTRVEAAHHSEAAVAALTRVQPAHSAAQTAAAAVRAEVHFREAETLSSQLYSCQDAYRRTDDCANHAYYVLRYLSSGAALRDTEGRRNAAVRSGAFLRRAQAALAQENVETNKASRMITDNLSRAYHPEQTEELSQLVEDRKRTHGEDSEENGRRAETEDRHRDFLESLNLNETERAVVDEKVEGTATDENYLQSLLDVWAGRLRQYGYGEGEDDLDERVSTNYFVEGSV